MKYHVLRRYSTARGAEEDTACVSGRCQQDSLERDVSAKTKRDNREALSPSQGRASHTKP